MRRLLSRGFALALLCASVCGAAELPEYELKAAFLYNFALFTEWPATVGRELTLCTYGGDPFGAGLDDVAGKSVGERTLRLQRRVSTQSLVDCHILYIGREAIGSLAAVRERVAGRPVLIVTDSPGALRAGATINMAVAEKRVTFEVSRRAASQSGLGLSYRLLRLATQVIQ
jgi:hypothetical protein